MCSPGCIFGNGVADALLGLPTFWINGFSQYISGTLGEYDFFGQDRWKVRHNLVLNPGIRYEYKGLTTDKFDHIANFDFNKGLLLVAGRSAATLEDFDPTSGLYVPVGKGITGEHGGKPLSSAGLPWAAATARTEVRKHYGRKWGFRFPGPYSRHLLTFTTLAGTDRDLAHVSAPWGR